MHVHMSHNGLSQHGYGLTKMCGPGGPLLPQRYKPLSAPIEALGTRHHITGEDVSSTIDDGEALALALQMLGSFSSLVE